MMKLGVIVDSFRLPIREGIKKAAELGLDGIQIYAVSGEMAPENLTPTARKEILSYIKGLGLKVSALVGDPGGHGFTIHSDNPARIDQSKRIMDLAKDLEADIVSTHIGVIPSLKTHVRYQVLSEAMNKIGEYAEQVGGYFAIETGPENCRVLKEFIEGLDNQSIKVNYDPANLLMVTGDDPIKGVKLLGDLIVHTHAKDGIMVKQTDPEMIYNYFAEGGIEDLRLDDYFKEMPLGRGHLQFERYLSALSEIGYQGFLTIEREVGDNPITDIREAVNFLKNIVKE